MRHRRLKDVSNIPLHITFVEWSRLWPALCALISLTLPTSLQFIPPIPIETNKCMMKVIAQAHLQGLISSNKLMSDPVFLANATGGR